MGSQRYDVVNYDHFDGACELTTFLLELGHRDIWCLTDRQFPWFADSFEGYRYTMEQAGLPARVYEIHSNERELGYLGTKVVLASGEPVTAIFAASDLIAQGAYRVLADSGIKVPDEISVVGFNDSEGAILHPALTTVRSFPEEMRAHLAEFVLDRISKPDLPPRQLTIPMRLVRRESAVRPQTAAIQPASVST